MSEQKFYPGDKVKIIKSGSGFNERSIGQIVTIKEYKGPTSYGSFPPRPGYSIEEHELHGNPMHSSYKGVNGENSFKLVKREEINYEIY